MSDELKSKLGKLLIDLLPQIEKDFVSLPPKERIELWMSFAAMYLHETPLSFLDDEADDSDDEVPIYTNDEYN